MDHAGNIAVADETDRATRLAHAGDQVRMARPVKNDSRYLRWPHAFGLGEPDDVFFRRSIEINHSFRVARPDGDLFHVDVRRMQERPAFGHGHGCDGAGHVLGAKRRAFEWIDRDIDLWPFLGPDLFADEQHGGFVEFALADHDRPVDGQLVELSPHCVDGCLVRRLFNATTAQACRRHRRALGDAHDFDRKNTFQYKTWINGNG